MIHYIVTINSTYNTLYNNNNNDYNTLLNNNNNITHKLDNNNNSNNTLYSNILLVKQNNPL